MINFLCKKSIVLSLSAIFSVGCSESASIKEGDLKAAISSYLTTDLLCIWTGHVFPVDVGDSYMNQVGTNAFLPLAEAGILSATRAFVEKKKNHYESTLIRVPVTRYELTKQGQSLAKTDIPRQSGIEGTKFCPVQVEVVEITNYTIPAQGSTSQATTVDYKYRISNVAAWGTAAVIRNNRLLEEMVQSKGKLIPGKNVLVRTKNGWEVMTNQFF